MANNVVKLSQKRTIATGPAKTIETDTLTVRAWGKDNFNNQVWATVDGIGTVILWDKKTIAAAPLLCDDSINAQLLKLLDK
jgi:hypothetical protein